MDKLTKQGQDFSDMFIETLYTTYHRDVHISGAGNGLCVQYHDQHIRINLHPRQLPFQVHSVWSHKKAFHP